MRVLGSEFYGLWAILHAIVQIAGVGTAGISSIVNKFASESHLDSKKEFGGIITGGVIIVFFLSILTALILIAVHGLIIDNIEISSASYQIQFKKAIFIIAFSLIPQFISRVYQGFLFSQLKHKLAKQIELIYQIALWGGVVLISFWQKNLVLIALWCLLLTCLTLAAYVITVKRAYDYQVKINSVIIRSMLKFSGYLFLETLAITMFQQMDVVIVGITLGPSIAGIYSVGTSISVRLSSVTGQITEVMIPYASLKDSINDHQKLYSTYRRLSYYVSLLVALIGAAAIIWMHELLTIWMSADYAVKYGNFYQILIIAYCFISLTRPAHQTLTGMGKVKFTSITYAITMVLMLTSLYFLSKQLGFLGAVLSDCLMILLMFYVIYTYQTLNNRIPWRDFFKDIGVGFFSPIITYFIIHFVPGIGIKIAVSIIFLVSYIYIFLKDDWLKTEIKKLLQTHGKKGIKVN